MELKNSALIAVRWSALSTGSRAILQFLQVVILARLLQPGDFGLMAMVLAVLGFIQVFTDLGISNAIIHSQKISNEELSSLYWLNLGVGCVLTILLIASSDILGSGFFHEPRLRWVLATISVNLFLNSVGQQVRVMAEKSFRFKVLAKSELISSIAGFTTAVIWAYVAPSVYALVGALVVNNLMQTILLWRWAADGWRPQLRFRYAETKPYLKFGAYMLATNFVNNFNSQVDIFIASRMCPPAALGAYSLPRNLGLTIAGVINPIVTRVGLPLISKAQGQKEFLRHVYLKTMNMTASLNFPIYLGMAVFSQEAVSLIFGPKWDSAAPLLRFLALWGLFRSCANPINSLLLGVGRPDLSFKWNLAMLFVTPPCLWGAAHWGIEGIAVTQTLLMALLLLPMWYFLVRNTCGASGIEYFRSFFAPALCSVLALAPAYVMAHTIEGAFFRLALAVLVTTPLYLVFSFFFNPSSVSVLKQFVSTRLTA